MRGNQPADAVPRDGTASSSSANALEKPNRLRVESSGLAPCITDRWHCGSRSRTSGWPPSRTQAAARLSVVVVFPTPPFWLKTAMRMRHCSVPSRSFVIITLIYKPLFSLKISPCQFGAPGLCGRCGGRRAGTDAYSFGGASRRFSFRASARGCDLDFYRFLEKNGGLPDCYNLAAVFRCMMQVRSKTV